MNDKFKELWEKAGGHYSKGDQHKYPEYTIDNIEIFVEILKKEICDEVKEELVDDDIIEKTNNLSNMYYLRGCNGGLVDALCIIQNFGVDINEQN